MTGKKNPFKAKALLWWVSIISLAVAASLYFLLKEQAQYDVTLDQRRMFFPVVGILIAGICLICGTASRWFHTK
ncbi:MAG: hypothetical protein ABFR47_00600 [Verrucomicrobiota bacterium]